MMREKRWRGGMGLLVALVLAACAPPAQSEITLILDFVPGGIHAGIYSALEEGYFDEAGIDVDIQPPASAADTLRLVLAGQATIGIAPVGDVASLKAEGEPVRIILALEQVPLVSLISTEAIGVTDPAQLGGATVGVTGVPSDEAVARFILDASGVDTEGVEFITIGFDAVGNLIGRTVDAAVGFRTAEAVALEMAGEEPMVFPPEDYGAPTFPELVFFVAEETVRDRPEALGRFTEAVARGYRFALDSPGTAVDHLISNTDGVDAEFASAELAEVSPYFLDENGNFGHIDESEFDRYLEWAAQAGIVDSAQSDVLTTEFMP